MTERQIAEMQAKIRAADERAKKLEGTPGVKVWRATVSKECEIYVLAETEDEANKLVRRHGKSELRNVDGVEETFAQIVDPANPPHDARDYAPGGDNDEAKPISFFLEAMSAREKEAEERARIEANQLPLFPVEVKE